MPSLDIKVTGDDTTVETISGSTSAGTPVAGQMSQPVPPPTVSPQPAQPLGMTGPLPEFERVQVAKTEIKISGAVAVDTRDEVTVGLDDRLRVCGEFRVVKVNHYVDKQGNVVRQQVLAPITDLELVPWDISNPNDNGIVRAHV